MWWNCHCKKKRCEVLKQLKRFPKISLFHMFQNKILIHVSFLADSVDSLKFQTMFLFVSSKYSQIEENGKIWDGVGEKYLGILRKLQLRLKQMIFLEGKELKQFFFFFSTYNRKQRSVGLPSVLWYLQFIFQRAFRIIKKGMRHGNMNGKIVIKLDIWLMKYSNIINFRIL